MSRFAIIVALVVVALIGIGTYAYTTGHLTTVTNTITDVLTADNAVPAPELATSKAVTATIDAKAGGKIRVIDDTGMVMTLIVPPDALTTDTDITLTPFTSSADGLRQGVTISPAEVAFATPATLSFNWNMLAMLSGKKSSYAKRPAVLTYDQNTETVTLTPLSFATLAPNYVPATISGAGSFGVSVDGELIVAAAAATLDQESSSLQVLAAGISLANAKAHTSDTTKQVTTVMEEILNSQEPPLPELELAALLSTKLPTKTTFIPTAFAYGITDGYLQLRCNQDITTYEEALISMNVAAHLGFAEVAETCKKRAEKILMELAEATVRDKTIPIIDVVEVLTQMQLLGLDDSGRGAVLAESLVNDVLATSEDLNNRLGGETDDDGGGTARGEGRSRPPLTGNDTNLPMELFAIQFLPLLGINAYDEASWKDWGDRTHTQMDGMIMMGRELCAMLDDPMFAGMPGMAEAEKNCAKVESDKMTEGMEVWHKEVDEYAEGVDDVQSGNTPNQNWSDTSPLDPFMEWLES